MHHAGCTPGTHRSGIDDIQSRGTSDRLAMPNRHRFVRLRGLRTGLSDASARRACPVLFDLRFFDTDLITVRVERP